MSPPANPAYGSDPAALNAENLFLQDLQSGSPNNTPQQILQQLAGAGAPQEALLGLESALAQNQYGLAGSQYSLTTAGLGMQYADQQAQYELSQQQNALSQLGLRQEAGLLGITTSTEQQQYGIEQQGGQYVNPITGQAINAPGQYAEQYAQALQGYTTNLQNLQGNLGATGASNTIGAGRQLGVLGQEYQWQQSDVARAQAVSQLQQQATSAQQQYSGQQIQNQQQALSIVAAQNGISMQQAEQQLQQGLTQAGLDYRQALPQLLQSMAQIYAGQLTGAEGYIAQAGLAGGISNMFPAGAYPA